MRFGIVLGLLLLGGSLPAQKKISRNGKLAGYLFEDQYAGYVIKFKGNHHYVVTKKNNIDRTTQKLEGIWRLDGETLTLTDQQNGRTWLVLEKQKGNWYLRDDNRAYTFKGQFWPYTKRPFKSGSGC